jgi:hypothetical protein
MDHLATQVEVGVLANPAKLGLSPGRILVRHEPDPSGKLAPTAKMSPVINTGDERRRDDWADAWYGSQASACRVISADRHEARIQGTDATLKIAQLIEEVDKHLTREIRQPCVRHCRRPLCGKPRWSLGQNDPVFSQQPANLIDQGGSLAD